MKKFFSVGLLMAGFILFCLDSAIFVMAEENMTTVSTSPSTVTSAVNVSRSVEEPSSTISTPSSSETSSIPTDPTTKEPPTTSEKSTSSEKVSITTASNGEKDANLSGNALYRLYHSGLKIHLYTMDKNEYSTLGTRGWKQEGVAWNTSPDKGEPVYRLYHAGLKVHFYTKDAYEYRVLGTRGWRQEGKVFH